MSDHDPIPGDDPENRLPPDPSAHDTIRVPSGGPAPSADTIRDPGDAPRTARLLPPIDGYELLEEIGRGGMGVVFRARQLAAGGRVVALKVMLGEAFARPEELRRFEREVEIASDLNHPNIARIYDSGLTHGQHYFAMEYIDGLPLDVYCTTRTLRLEDRLQLFTTVCEAVAFAHRRGIIHRDLKPSNILIDSAGQPHVLDFGLAKTRTDDDAAARSLLTIDGAILGTLPYMAPEQAEGLTSSIDTRTDVYALGVILYELLTGKYPYEVTGQMADVLKRIAEAEPKRPSTVNRLIGNEVETIILRALHKAPDRRYAGADDLARDVARFLAHEPIEAKRDSGWYVLRKTMRRHRVPVAFALAIILLIAAAAVTSFALYRRAEAQRKDAEAAKAEEQRQRSFAQANEQKASASGKEATHRLALQFFNEGIAWWFDRQDAAMASACLAEALRVSPEPFPAARMALNNALRQCPQMSRPPVAEMEDIGYVNHGLFSSDGKRVVVVRSRSWQIWDTTTGQPISPLIQGSVPDFDPTVTRRLVIDGENVRVLDAITGTPVCDLMQHGGKFLSKTFISDGKRLVTVSDDKMLRVWNAVTGQPVSPCISLDLDYAYVVLSPDGSRLAAQPKETKKPQYFVETKRDRYISIRPLMGPLRIWDVESGRMISNAPNIHLVRGDPFSPDGKQILAASSDSLQIMEVDTWKPVSALMKIPRELVRASLSLEGKRVLMCAEAAEDLAQVWDATTGLPLFAPMKPDPYSSSFSPDGRWVITHSSDYTVRIWEAATGRPLFAPMHHQPSSGGAVQSAGYGQALCSSGMKHVITSFGMPRVWDLAGSEPASTTINYARADEEPYKRNGRASFSMDGKRVLTTAGGQTKETWVWDSTTGLPVSGPIPGRGASFTPDDSRVVICSPMSVWDAATGQRVSGPIKPAGSAGSVPRDTWVLDQIGSRRFGVRDAATGWLISDTNYNGRVWVFSPDRQWFTTLSEDKTARVWDAATCQPISAPMQHDGTVRYARFSPDGKRVVTASDDKTARVWDAATGHPISPPMTQHSGVKDASFSPDGSRIVTILNDGTVRVWDPVTGIPVSALMRHQSAWVSASFSPDGRWVITAAGLNPTGSSEESRRQGSVRLWDANTGQPVSAPMHEGCGVTSVEFSPDGKRALVGTRIGEVRIWTIDDVDWNEPIDLIQERVRARLGVGVAPTGDVQPLSTEELAAAWRDYQRLQADYERTRPKKASETAVAPTEAPPAQKKNDAE